ncbi:MAG: hypothetical protein ACI4PG_03970 [Candidatus Ventricola sp.]
MENNIENNETMNRELTDEELAEAAGGAGEVWYVCVSCGYSTKKRPPNPYCPRCGKRLKLRT